MIYTDGLVALFAFGGIYGMSIFGWSTIELGLFGILLMATGAFGAFVGGRLDDRIGSRAVIIGSLMLLIAAAAVIISIDRTHIFFVIAISSPLTGGGIFAGLTEQIYVVCGCVIGIAAGPLQASSRTLVARLAPKEMIGQFFGLFALSGKVTSFMGPFLVGLITDLTMSQRQGMSVLLIFFLIGLMLVAGVKTSAAKY
jgi:UMF1 family MFS transporter